MVNIRKLPIGIQTFEKIINNRQVYVDKTHFISKLVSNDGMYFLSRPRRFGKSLFVSTLDAYFSGKKELFNGLAIAEDEPQMAAEEGRDEWIKYPVIYINFDGVDLTSYEEFLKTFADRFDKICKKYEADFTNIDSIPAKFENLIQFLYEKYNLPVVILIDEYDKPMLSAIDDSEISDRYIKFFKSFYGNLKGSDQYIKFAFITGVTKFSKISIFSDLNNLKDISLDNRYADICGITKAELLSEFRPEIATMAEENNLTYQECLAQLKKHYDGYHFSSNLTDVYNPFCLLNAFDEKRFGNYWFESGTPTFLIKAIHQSDFDIYSFSEGIEVGIKSINAYKLDFSNIIPMMYQSGYLTIKSYDLDYNTCILGYPNEEVRYAFMEQLALEYTYLTHDSTKLDSATFSKYVCKGETDKFMTAIKAIFAHIPYPTSQKQYELNYQTIFYLIFTLMGQRMRTEVYTNEGRIDAVCETKDFVYLFEFKLDGTVEDALQQIEDKDYAVGYEASNKQIVRIGVAIDTAKRNIKDYKII
ncbi:MAG: ATP-binding protein [Spirochaetales bacterium]|nr:ATP-binding protein [Spirochaetales bacterium]